MIINEMGFRQNVYRLMEVGMESINGPIGLHVGPMFLLEAENQIKLVYSSDLRPTF